MNVILETENYNLETSKAQEDIKVITITLDNGCLVIIEESRDGTLNMTSHRGEMSITPKSGGFNMKVVG